MKRYFPHPRVLDSVQQQSKVVVPAGNGNNGRGFLQGGCEGSLRGCGGRENGSRNEGKGNVQPGREVAIQDYMAQCYAFPGNNEVEYFDAMITCTILVCDRMVCMIPVLVILMYLCDFPPSLI